MVVPLGIFMELDFFPSSDIMECIVHNQLELYDKLFIEQIVIIQRHSPSHIYRANILNGALYYAKFSFRYVHTVSNLVLLA